MKLSKSDLKSIVKECLIEILNEGVGGNSIPKTPKTPTTRLPNIPQRQQTQNKIASPSLREAIKRESGGNSVMESILADTAASTLPAFLQNDGKTPIPSTAAGGLVEQVVANARPEDLFGDEATSKWAALAFMDSPTKK